MLLTPTEMERLTIFTAAELSRKRKAKGLKLNHPEAIAFITDEILEGAREGRSVADLISFGSTLLSTDDVLPGVSDLISMIQVEGTFPDGTKLVTVHDPIRPGKKKVGGVSPGELDCEEGEIEINAGRRSVTIKVVNTGDRPVQIGSHYHFFETNKALSLINSISSSVLITIFLESIVSIFIATITKNTKNIFFQGFNSYFYYSIYFFFFSTKFQFGFL